MRNTFKLALISSALVGANMAKAAEISLQQLHTFGNFQTIMMGGDKGMLPAKPPVLHPNSGKLIGSFLTGGGSDFATIRQSGIYYFTPQLTEGALTDYNTQVNALNNDISAFDTNLVVNSKGAVYGGAKSSLFTWSEDEEMLDALADLDLTAINGGEFEIHGLLTIDADDNVYFAASERGSDFYALLRLSSKGEIVMLIDFSREEYKQASGDAYIFTKGQSPAALIFSAQDNAIYGLAHKSGDSAGAGSPEGLADGDFPSGTLFKLDLATAQTDGSSQVTVLNTFSNELHGLVDDHALSTHALVEDGEWLYGTSEKTVWRIHKTKQESFTVIHTFDAEMSESEEVKDGNTPTGPLVLAEDGNIYGTTSSGGNDDGSGILYRINLSEDAQDLNRHKDSYEIVQQFTGKDSISPMGLSLGALTDGEQTIYGVTKGNNTTDSGGVFQFAVKQHSLSFTTEASELTLGESLELNWQSSNLSECTASGNWEGAKEADGQESLEPQTEGDKSYILTCHDTDQKAFVRSLEVVVNPAPQPDPTPDPKPDTGTDPEPKEEKSSGALGGLTLLFSLVAGRRLRKACK